MLDGFDVQLEDLTPEYREIAEVIGLASALALVESRGGEKIYVPKAEMVSRHARDRKIRSEFDGGNYRELARRYHLTETWVRQIVAATSTGVDVIDRQLKLF